MTCEFIPAPALSAVKPSATMVVTQRARQLKAEGRDVLSLSMGEPDFDTPAHIAEAAIEAIRAGQTRYTTADGTPALKDAMIYKFKRDNGLDYAAEEVVATSGGKYLIFSAMLASLHPGDEVVIPAPYWVSYPDIVRLAGGEPVIVSAPASDGFLLSPEALEQAITPRTKWVFLNSPNNPTGAVYSPDQLTALGEVLRRHPHVWLMTDDLYEHIIFEETFATLPQIVPDLKDRTLIVNGVSKAYAMTGWRLGVGAGPVPLMAAMRKLIGQSTSNPCSVTQAAAVAALTGDHDFLDGWRAAYCARRDLMVAGLSQMDGIECLRPGGAFYVFPGVQALLGRRYKDQWLHTDIDFAEALLDAEAVATVPGTAFGMPGHIRISYATDEASLRDALARIGRFVGDLAAT